VARHSPHLFPEIIERASPKAAGRGRYGRRAVDIFSKEVEVALFERSRLTLRRGSRNPRSTTRPREIVRHLLEARTPLLYGGGILLANAAPSALVEHQLPAHSLMGKGALPDDQR
jgi:acetolactate synthase-1/2/3 large subunit